MRAKARELEVEDERVLRGDELGMIELREVGAKEERAEMGRFSYERQEVRGDERRGMACGLSLWTKSGLSPLFLYPSRLMGWCGGLGVLGGEGREIE